MKIQYDDEVDAAYIYFNDDKAHPSNKTITTHECDVDPAGGMIHLDLDETGQLVGIEILMASRRLPKELLIS